MEVEQVVDKLLEQEPDFDQLDLGPTPKPRAPSTLEVLVASDTPVSVSTIVQRTGSELQMVLFHLRYWEMRNFVQQFDSESWNATSAGIAYARGTNPQEDIEEPDINQLDTGPEPEMPELSTIQWKVLDALGQSGAEEGMHVSEIEQAMRWGNPVSMRLMLRYLMRLGLAAQVGHSMKWYLSARGSAYWNKWKKAGPAEDIDQPDADRVDFGNEVLPTDFEPDILTWRLKSDHEIGIGGETQALAYLQSRYDDRVRSVESTAVVTFYMLKDDVVGMLDRDTGILYLYKCHYPGVGR